MGDISTAWSPAAGRGDWYFAAPAPSNLTDEYGRPIEDQAGEPIPDGLFFGIGDLLVGDDLGTAILISLFTDATAGDDDIPSDGTDDRRGWWGDLDQDRAIGSKIWLRERSRQDDLTLALVKADIATALQWLIDDGVASAVDVATEWTRPGMLGSRVTVIRASGAPATLSFDWAWKEIA